MDIIKRQSILQVIYTESEGYIFNIRDFRIVIDYGHNIAGYLNVSRQ